MIWSKTKKSIEGLMADKLQKRVMFYLLPPVFLLPGPSQALVFINWVLDKS